MSLALYMDVHVPAAITRGLRRRGVEVLTAQEDKTTRLDDPDLLDRADALGRILFTRDEDLLAVAAERLLAAKLSPAWCLPANWRCRLAGALPIWR